MFKFFVEAKIYKYIFIHICMCVYLCENELKINDKANYIASVSSVQCHFERFTERCKVASPGLIAGRKKKKSETDSTSTSDHGNQAKSWAYIYGMRCKWIQPQKCGSFIIQVSRKYTTEST